MEDPQPVVYFVVRLDGLIKIGWTGNIAQRQRTLKTAAGPVAVLATIPGGPTEEKFFHEMFSSLRVWRRQEWFRPGPELLEFINQAVDAQSAEALQET